MPKRPCSGGCGALVDTGRCLKCSGGRPGGDGRESSSRRGYDAHWRKTRDGYLKKHPLCADPDGIHARAGAVVPATQLDHITPHKGDKTLFWTRENWQGLCASCHSRKTAFEGGFGNSYRYGTST
ncbi:MAG: HNH endonuclease [Acidobacteriota bacterium]|nr:HNH endonuclease [Acidobacteriota bacterium]